MPKPLTPLSRNNDVTDVFCVTQMMSRTESLSCKNSAQIKQGTREKQNKAEIKTSYSSGKKVLPIKKDLECFQETETTCEFCLLN